MRRRAQFARLPHWALKIIYRRASHYLRQSPRFVRYEDLVTEGMIGALRGAMKWRPERGSSLRTWVYDWIDWTMRHHIRDERDRRGHKAWQQDRGIGELRETTEGNLTTAEVAEARRYEQARSYDPDYAAQVVLRECIGRLMAMSTPKQRQLLQAVLDDPDGTMEEWAEAVGCKTGQTWYEPMRRNFRPRMEAIMA